jgi:hypothetical protein
MDKHVTRRREEEELLAVPDRRGVVVRGTTQEQDVTEIEERIQTQRESAENMRRQLACECPDKSCMVEHES